VSVTDLSHDEDGFHEIQLSGKQLVFLFMTGTVVLVVIFLCGVLVGRGVREQRLAEPIDDTAAATAAPAQPVADVGPQAAEPPTPAPESADELSYHRRLQGDRAPAEELKAPTAGSAAAPPAPAPPPSVPAAAATAPAAGRPGTWFVQVQALKDRAGAESLAKRLGERGYPAYVVSPSAESPVKLYRVQVGRYSDRREAEQVVSRLKKEEQFDPWISR
jgi:rare lipoprotein A